MEDVSTTIEVAWFNTGSPNKTTYLQGPQNVAMYLYLDEVTWTTLQWWRWNKLHQLKTDGYETTGVCVCVCVRMHACVCEWLENAQQVAATNLSIRNTGTDIAWYMVSAWTCACHPSEQPAAETAMFHWTMSWMTFPTASDNHGVSHYNMMRHSSPLMNLTPLVNAWSEF